MKVTLLGVSSCSRDGCNARIAHSAAYRTHLDLQERICDAAHVVLRRVPSHQQRPQDLAQLRHVPVATDKQLVSDSTSSRLLRHSLSLAASPLHRQHDRTGRGTKATMVDSRCIRQLLAIVQDRVRHLRYVSMEAGCSSQTSSMRTTPVRSTPWWRSLRSCAANGSKLSIVSGTFRMILRAKALRVVESSHV